MMSGAGCNFLVALACYLAKGKSLEEAIGLFKEYICSIIKESIDTKTRQKPPTLARSEINLSCFLHGG